MTRAELLATYDVAGSVITSPGKFEGAPVYAPHFHDLALAGGADETLIFGHDVIDVVTITASDRAEFPELATELRPQAVAVTVFVDSQGFVYVQPVTVFALDQLRARAADDHDDHDHDDR